VVEEEARAGVERGDRGQVVVGELEVEDVEVLGHAVRADRLRDDDDSALDQPAEHDLGDGLAVRLGDRGQHRVREVVVPAFGERAPGLVLNTVLAHEGLLLPALMEHVRLDLVHRGRDLVVLDQVDEPIGVEVRDADRTDPAFPVEVLHRPPLAVVVAVRLVDQIQIEVVQAQAPKRCLERPLGVVLAGVLDPEFGGDEQLLAGNTALRDRPPYRLLVVVPGGGVDRAISGCERVADRLLRLLRRNLEHAESENRHLNPVVQGNSLHGGTSVVGGGCELGPVVDLSPFGVVYGVEEGECVLAEEQELGRIR